MTRTDRSGPRARRHRPAYDGIDGSPPRRPARGHDLAPRRRHEPDPPPVERPGRRPAVRADRTASRRRPGVGRHRCRLRWSGGLRGERVASGLRVRYSGGRTADAVLLSLVDEVRGADGPVATAAVLVVTDDRDLRHALRRKGARTAGAAWLLGRLERTERGRPGRPSVADPGSAIGTGRRTRASTGPMTRSTTPIPRRDSRSTGDRDAGARSDPRAHGVSDADPVLEAGPDADTDRPGWQPGRGATTKRGNPRRAPRRRTG